MEGFFVTDESKGGRRLSESDINRIIPAADMERCWPMLGASLDQVLAKVRAAAKLGGGEVAGAPGTGVFMLPPQSAPGLCTLGRTADKENQVTALSSQGVEQRTEVTVKGGAKPKSGQADRAKAPPLSHIKDPEMQKRERLADIQRAMAEANAQSEAKRETLVAKAAKEQLAAMRKKGAPLPAPPANHTAPKPTSNSAANSAAISALAPSSAASSGARLAARPPGGVSTGGGPSGEQGLNGRPPLNRARGAVAAECPKPDQDVRAMDAVKEAENASLVDNAASLMGKREAAPFLVHRVDFYKVHAAARASTVPLMEKLLRCSAATVKEALQLIEIDRKNDVEDRSTRTRRHNFGSPGALLPHEAGEGNGENEVLLPASDDNKDSLAKKAQIWKMLVARWFNHTCAIYRQTYGKKKGVGAYPMRLAKLSYRVFQIFYVVQMLDHRSTEPDGIKLYSEHMREVIYEIHFLLGMHKLDGPNTGLGVATNFEYPSRKKLSDEWFFHSYIVPAFAPGRVGGVWVGEETSREYDSSLIEEFCKGSGVEMVQGEAVPAKPAPGKEFSLGKLVQVGPTGDLAVKQGIEMEDSTKSKPRKSILEVKGTSTASGAANVHTYNKSNS
eukprot:gene17072-23364_t